MCYFPESVIVVILISSVKDSIPIYVKHILFHLLSLFSVMNPLFNPLIYAVRIRYFRVASIQLLSRKTIAQAEQLERNIFRPNQNRVVATAEHGGGGGEVEHGNETLNCHN